MVRALIGHENVLESATPADVRAAEALAGSSHVLKMRPSPRPMPEVHANRTRPHPAPAQTPRSDRSHAWTARARDVSATPFAHARHARRVGGPNDGSWGAPSACTVPLFIGSELALLVTMFGVSRYVLPLVDRHDRGATGEEHVGGLLDELADEGWRVIHDASFGYGNVDHIALERRRAFHGRDQEPTRRSAREELSMERCCARHRSSARRSNELRESGRRRWWCSVAPG